MKRAFLIAAFATSLILLVSMAVAQVSPWPKFRHDDKNTGRSPYTGPGTPVLEWAYPTTEGVASSPSIGPDGTIYVGAGWYFQFSTDSSLYALNPDGTLKWKFTTDRGIFSSPAIADDGTIYVGSMDRYLYAIEDSVTYGKLKWRSYTGHWVFGSPVIGDDGSVYVGSLNWVFWAYDPLGNVKWSDTAIWCFFSSAIIDDDGYIYVGNKDHNLYAYNDLGTSFEYRWVHPVGTFFDGHNMDSSPAMAEDGTIYVGTDPYGAAGYDPILVDTNFFAINYDGSRKWAFVTGDGVESSPAIGENGTVYFGSYDSCVYALRDMGTHAELYWKYKTGGPVDASPTVGGDGTIYIGSRDSTMYAFNPDGSILWTYDVGQQIESSVTIAGDGRIYFGGMGGAVPGGAGAIFALGEIGSDVGPITLGLPDKVADDTTINPTVTVRNFRTTQESFSVALLIKNNEVDVYGDTVDIVDLDGGADFQAAFEPWVIGPGEDQLFDITLVSLLGTDNNNTNDTLLSTVLAGETYICGDANGNGTVNILDVTLLINFLYKGGPAPDPYESGNADGTLPINILDVTFLINYLYKDGPEPVC